MVRLLCDVPLFLCAFVLQYTLDLHQSAFVSGFKYECENYFVEGGWALVRRVKQGSTWHPSTDSLAGTHVYGSYSPSTADVTFSVPFRDLLVTDNTEVLFATGMCHVFC